MFKTKLIESKDFYYYRRKLLILTFASIPVYSSVYGLLNISLLKSNIYAVILLMGVITASVFVLRKQYKLRKKTDILIKNKRIEVSDKTIQIINADKSLDVEYEINELSHLIVKDVYAIPEENIKDFIDEFRGDGRKNYIIYKTDNKSVRFDFVIDSYYMIEQLKKVVTGWKANNVRVESVS